MASNTEAAGASLRDHDHMHHRQRELDQRDWQRHYDNRLDAISERQDQRHQELTGRVASMETMFSGELGEIRALLSSALKNQEGVFTRLNRPVGPLILAAIALSVTVVSTLAAFVTLTINPIEAKVIELADHSEKIDFYFDERVNSLEEEAAESRRDRYWLEKLEVRGNEQQDKIWAETKRLHPGAEPHEHNDWGMDSE